MKFTRFIFAMASLTSINLAQAQESTVDWKVYGGAKVDGTELCFYDAKSITQTKEGNIDVWVKCLGIKEMDAIDVKKDYDGKIVENAGTKVHDDYVSPISKIEPTSFDQNVMYITYEEIADIGSIQPHAEILNEINCSEKMIRELSIHLNLGGKTGSKEQPGGWQHVPPEGNGINLIKLLCPISQQGKP